MPPKKTTTTKKGTQADNWTSPCIIELPPSNPPSPPPESLGSQDDSDHELPSGNLAAALPLLAQSLSSPKKSSTQTKVHEPDVFDGWETCKLQPFLVQCTPNFRNCPDAFSNDSAKVTFALSYLKRTVLNWFELLLTSSLTPTWLNDYSDFVLELKKNFRPHNPKCKAEADLKNLYMHKNQRIMKYLVNFNHLTAHIQWGEATLCWQLYHGLPSHIKDIIVRVGKQDTLTYSINSHYWECHSKVARETLSDDRSVL